MTVKDVMPRGKADQVDRNPEMVVNIKDNTNCVDFILVQDVKVAMPNGKSKGMSLPSEQVFREIVNKALTNTVSIEMGWCNVVTRRGVNRQAIGIIQINYGYQVAAEVFRDSISGQSTEMVEYNTYPAVDILKKYGVTVFFHSGYKGIPTHLLGGGLKGGNPDMRGDFEVVESRTLKFEDREECRLVSLDCSEDFLKYLATKTRNWKYAAYGMKVYINEGKRSDSQSEYTVPELSKETSTKIVQANSGIILQYSAARLGYQKQFSESTRLIKLNSYVTYLQKPKPNHLFSLLSRIGTPCKEKRIEGTPGLANRVVTRREKGHDTDERSKKEHKAKWKRVFKTGTHSLTCLFYPQSFYVPKDNNKNGPGRTAPTYGTYCILESSPINEYIKKSRQANMKLVRTGNGTYKGTLTATPEKVTTEAENNDAYPYRLSCKHKNDTNVRVKQNKSSRNKIGLKKELAPHEKTIALVRHFTSFSSHSTQGRQLKYSSAQRKAISSGNSSRRPNTKKSKSSALSPQTSSRAQKQTSSCSSRQVYDVTEYGKISQKLGKPLVQSRITNQIKKTKRKDIPLTKSKEVYKTYLRVTSRVVAKTGKRIILSSTYASIEKEESTGSTYSRHRETRRKTAICKSYSNPTKNNVQNMYALKHLARYKGRVVKTQTNVNNTLTDKRGKQSSNQDPSITTQIRINRIKRTYPLIYSKESRQKVHRQYRKNIVKVLKMEHPNESAQGLAAYIDRNTSSIHPQKHKNSSKLKRVTYKNIDTNQKTRPQNPIQDRRINLSTLDSSKYTKLNASSPTSKMDSSKTKTRERHVTSKVRIPKYKGHKVQMTCLRHVTSKV